MLWPCFYHHLFLQKFSLNKLLALPNSHISIESRLWSKQLVGTWETVIFSFNFQSSFYFKLNLCELMKAQLH